MMTVVPTIRPVAVRVGGVAALTSLTAEQIDDLVREGRFPRPVKVGHRTRIWSVAALEKWMDEQSLLAAAG